MALFEKGNKEGKKFSSENQPQNRGRKPSIYKKLKAITSKKVGYELEKEDYFKVIRWVMEQNAGTLEVLIKDKDGRPNKDTPLWLINIISAINADIRYGRTTTVEMIFDRVFGKATQPIEGEMQVTNNSSADFSALSVEELLQYKALLKKIKGDGSE